MRTRQIHPRITVRGILRLVDRLVFCALCTTAVMIPLLRRERLLVFAVLIGAALLLLLTALDKRAAKRERERRFAETARTIRLEKLLLLSDREIGLLLNEPSLVLLRGGDPSVGEITDALREHPRCLAVPAGIGRALPIVQTHAPETRLLDADALLAAVDMPCTEREVTERMAQMKPKRRKPLRETVRFQGRAWKFLLLGILLLVLSLVWKHKIYYRVLSLASLGLSVIAGGFGFQKAHRNFGIFLDKIDK